MFRKVFFISLFILNIFSTNTIPEDKNNIESKKGENKAMKDKQMESGKPNPSDEDGDSMDISDDDTDGV